MPTNRRGFLASLAAITGGLALGKPVKLPTEPVVRLKKETVFPVDLDPSRAIYQISDETYDIGASGATRHRDMYITREGRVYFGQQPRRTISLSVLDSEHTRMLSDAFLKEQVVLVEHHGHPSMRMLITKLSVERPYDAMTVHHIELTEVFNLAHDVVFPMDRMRSVLHAVTTLHA